MNARSLVASVRTAVLIPVTMAMGLAATPALAGTAQQIANFGDNPSGIGMYLYTPTNVAAKPAILVNVHACHGKGTDVCQGGSAFAQQADKFGFLVVCPSAISSDGCWDVHSTAVLTHDGGGDAAGIVSMVNWVVQNKNGDADRVFVAGHSSGGMMTNVMLGSYPDLFKAGAAYAGVPFACYAQGSVDSLGWNTSCATGKVTMTGAKWGDLVRAAYPDFLGVRPHIQLWHGSTDDVVYPQNFKEEIKQWTNVLGVSETPTSTENNALQSGWIRTRYADGNGVVQVEAIEETGQPHNLVVDAAEAIRFFGLDVSNPVPDAGVKDAAKDSTTGTGGTGGGTGGVVGTGGSGRGGGSGGRDAGTGGGSGGASSIATGGSSGGQGGSTGTNTSLGGNGGNGATTGTSGVGGSGGVSTSGGTSAAGGMGGGGSGGTTVPSTGGSGGGAGGSAGSINTDAKSGGSTGQTTRVPNDKSKACSCDLNAAGRHPAAASWLLLLFTAFGLASRSRRRARLLGG